MPSTKMSNDDPDNLPQFSSSDDPSSKFPSSDNKADTSSPTDTADQPGCSNGTALNDEDFETVPAPMPDPISDQYTPPLSAPLAEPFPEAFGNMGTADFSEFAATYLRDGWRLRNAEQDMPKGSENNNRPVVTHLSEEDATEQLDRWLISVSKRTREQYHSTAVKLVNQVVDGRLNKFNAVNFTNAVAEKTEKSPAGTRSIYTSSVAWLFANLASLSECPEKKTAYLASFLIADAVLNGTLGKHSGHHTSQSHPNRLANADHHKIQNHLRSSKSKYAVILSNVLVVLVGVGLRPIETLDYTLQKLEDGSVRLVVQNCKFEEDASRSNGPTRLLLLKDVDESLIKALELVNQCAKIYSRDDWADLLQKCQRLLRDICVQIWGKTAKKKGHNHRLYDGRHQFAADMKLVFAGRSDDLAIVAALMGHATDETASKHYAKKKVGEKRGGRVFASATEVETVLRIKAKKARKKILRLQNRSVTKGKAFNA